MLLRKGVYPYEDMDSWKKIEETSLSDKKAFYSNLNLEDISDEDYVHAQKAWNAFEIRGEYHHLYVQSDTFAGRCSLEMCVFKYMDLILQIFVSAPALAWQVCLKKTEVKLELLTDYAMLLMIYKGFRGGIYQATHRYAKVNNKYMKNYDKNNESSYIEYLDANNLYGWAMSQKLPVKGFKWVKQKKLSKFNEDFKKKKKKKNEDSNTRYFLEVDIDYPKGLINFHKDLPSLPDRKKA